MDEARYTLSDDDATYVRRSVIKYWIDMNRGQDAEDLAHEGIVQCVKKIDKYKAKVGYQGRKASLRTFLVKVAINRGKDVVKKERRSDILAKKERKRSDESSRDDAGE